jgi:branched-chain amino acid transport system permease protein
VAVLASALIIGLTLGAVYGLMAFGMVASFRITGVVNMGQAGIAALSAAFYWKMEVAWGISRAVSLVCAVLAGGLMGAALGIVVLRVRWPKVITMILTLSVTLLLFAVASVITTPVDRLLNEAGRGITVFGDRGFDVGYTYVTVDQIGSFVTCLVVVLLTTWVLRASRFGLYVRVIYDDPAAAATLGIPLGSFVVRVWAMAGCLAALAGMLISVRTTLDTSTILFVMVWGLSGAVLGGLESFALAFTGGLALGISQGVLGSMLTGLFGPGMENLTAIAIVAAGVLYMGGKRRHLAHLQN